MSVILTPDVFKINVEAYVNRITSFIAAKYEELHRDGVLVSLSGGLDSSTVILLCARAVGKENVKALITPEKQGNPAAEKYALQVASHYGIETIIQDISAPLQALGVYDFILARLPSRRLQNTATKAYLSLQKENPYLKLKVGAGDEMMRRGYAIINTKHRLRAVVTFLIAEQNNYLVVGCAHKSEDFLGLYVKFGVDDIADLMPLRHLYRSHILQIARYVGVPDEIIHRAPNPDIIPGVNDKYVDILGLPSETLDLIIYGVEHQMRDDEIASQLSLAEEKVAEIRELIKSTEHMRHPSQTLTWDDWNPSE